MRLVLILVSATDDQFHYLIIGLAAAGSAGPFPPPLIPRNTCPPRHVFLQKNFPTILATILNITQVVDYKLKLHGLYAKAMMFKIISYIVKW